MANFSFEGLGAAEKPKARNIRLPAIFGAVLALLGAEASAQQAQGRPMTRADMEAMVGREEMERREAYERSTQTNPQLRAELAATARRQAQAQREGEAYCRQIAARIKREGYTAVENDIGGEGMMTCGF